MTRIENGIHRYRARTTTATIALVASGYLVMSGTTAVPAAAQNSTEVAKGGWSTLVSPSYVGALPKNATADTTAEGKSEAVSTISKATLKEDLFRSGPQYDKNYDSKSQVDIYGSKVAVEPPRPLELGRQQYT